MSDQGRVAPVAQRQGEVPHDHLTAIDILINPDETMLEHAREANARFRENLPDGFALDTQHTPHITTLQRYVRTADLDGVFDAVGKVLGSRDLSKLELRAALIDAVAPFVESGGTAAAYVTTSQEPDINQDTLRYIEHYVPEHSGPNYIGHVTIGLAKLGCLDVLESALFDEFAFHPAGFAVFKLGNNGTAQLELKAWNIS